MDINTKTSNYETHNTPPKPHHLIPLSFTNNKHHAPPSPHTYKECLKNHAASIGGHAVDGCGEYMPSPTDPTSLKCAVCDCHRNFHRQEPEQHCTTTPHFLSFHHHLPPPHALLKLSAKAAAQEDHPHQVVVTPMTPTAENVSTRKRFRTKFSGEQKEKMQAFSEKLGWRMSKSDEIIIEEFCKEIGVNKSVLKVWMHNNKTKKESNALTSNNGEQDNNVNFSQDHR